MTRSQNATLPVLAEGPEATHPWGKDFSWILKTQGWTPTHPRRVTPAAGTLATKIKPKFSGLYFLFHQAFTNPKSPAVQ